MRVDSESGVSSSTFASPAAPSKPGPPPAPPPGDRVDHRPREANVARLRDWVRNEWPTVASAAHGLAAAPGVVSQAWRDAAKTNDGLAKTIDSTIDHWQEQSAAQRQAAIDGLRRAAAPVSTTATNVADDLAAANRVPLAVQKAFDVLIANAPASARGSLSDVAQSVSSAVDKLPAAVTARAHAGSRALEAAAFAQTAKGATTVGALSEKIGRSVGGTYRSLTGNAEHPLLNKLPLLRDAPVLGVALTSAAVVTDMRGGKSAADALVANVAGSVIGTAAGNAASEGIAAWLDSAAIADGTAAALGAATAAGPVGWTVAAGVVVGAAVGFGVYKAVESKAGQDIINGATQLSGERVARGLGEAQARAIDAAENAGALAALRFEANP